MLHFFKKSSNNLNETIKPSMRFYIS